MDLTIEDDKVTDLNIQFVDDDELGEYSNSVYSVSSNDAVQEISDGVASSVYSID